MGNLGALASKPVMEGKAVLFKRFADVDAIDLELKTEDVDRFIDAVELMEPSFGEIGRAPSELQSLMRISYAVFCLKEKKKKNMNKQHRHDEEQYNTCN